MLVLDRNKIETNSLITTLYSSWEQYKVPAIYYHYFLSVLTLHEKKDQIAMMNRQIKLMRTNNHPYHLIINAIQARQRSLTTIIDHLPEITKSDHPIHHLEDHHHDYQASQYSMIFQSSKQEPTNRALIELINHIKMYQKVTYQVVHSIYSWEIELVKQGYTNPIQFLYQHQDYLQKIMKDTLQVIAHQSNLFEKNPFFLLRKEQEFTQYALIYHSLKFSVEFGKKVEESLEILSNHDTMMERYRILGRFNAVGNRKQIIKSESFHKIYSNHTSGRNYSIKSFKKHPVFVQSSPEDQLIQKLPHSQSLSNIVKQLNHKNVLALPEDYDSEINKGKQLEKKLAMYNQLDKTMRYPRQNRQTKSEKKQHEQNFNQKLEQKQIMNLEQEKQPEQTVKFCYQSNISPYDLIKYLRQKIFINQQLNLKDVENLAKIIISERQKITLLRVQIGEYLAAWLGIVFLSRDLYMHKAVQIVLSHKFLKIPNFQGILAQEFGKKGYGSIREKGKLVYSMEILEKREELVLKVKYKLLADVKQKEVKGLLKKHPHLKESRILKYYHYSKHSKYHRYCTNHSDTHCEIEFLAEEVRRISIGGQPYLKVKCDRITRRGNCYQIQHFLNQTNLLLATNMQDLFQIQNKDPLEVNSSQEEIQDSSTFQYLCLPETKIIHKYVDAADQAVLVEFLTINTDIKQIISLNLQKKKATNSLIIEKPFFAAFTCKAKEDQGKILSIFEFD